MIGSIVKLTGDIYQLIVASMYAEVAPRLFEALSEKPNVVFVHEAVLTSGEDSPEAVYFRHEDEESDFVFEQSFSRPSEETRVRVNQLLEKFNFNVLPIARTQSSPSSPPPLSMTTKAIYCFESTCLPDDSMPQKPTSFSRCSMIISTR